MCLVVSLFEDGFGSPGVMVSTWGFSVHSCVLLLWKGVKEEMVTTAGEVALGQAVVLAEGLPVLEQRTVGCPSESMGGIAYKLASLVLRSCKDIGRN